MNGQWLAQGSRSLIGFGKPERRRYVAALPSQLAISPARRDWTSVQSRGGGYARLRHNAGLHHSPAGHSRG